VRRSKPGLIIPIRDRRQRRRILTLKNFRNALLLLLAIFVGITIEANLRNPKTTDDYGRLYGRQIPSTSVTKPEIIHEAPPIADQNAADPMLVAPQARAQLLLADSNIVPPTTTTPASVAQPAPVAPTAGERVTLVGGPEGVSIAREKVERPVLGGGFGKQ
jgi:hypothetical protein